MTPHQQTSARRYVAAPGSPEYMGHVGHLGIQGQMGCLCNHRRAWKVAGSFISASTGMTYVGGGRPIGCVGGER